MMEIVKPLEYIIGKLELPNKLLKFINDKIFLNKLIQSERYHENKRLKEWVKTAHGFSIMLYLPNIYDEYNKRTPKISIISNSGIIEHLTLLIKINQKNEIIQKVIEFYDIGEKPINTILNEIPYRDIYVTDKDIVLSYKSIEIYIIKNDKKILINNFYPTNFDLLNSRYIFKNGYYWNSAYIESEMEDLLCKNNRVIDKIIFKIISKKEYASFSYKMVSFIYWLKVLSKK
jgi:hypothetical protein